MRFHPTPIAALVFALVAIASGCRPTPSYRRAEGVDWNTTYCVKYKSDRDLSDSVTAAMRRVELSLSPFNPGSLVAAINRGESDSIDSRLREIFFASQRVNRISAGAFDPTVAPLINLWGFGYDNGVDQPSQAMIDSCLSLVGIADCRIDGERLVRKDPSTQFNFSAITKGYGCDEVGRALASAGCTDYMVEIGGELSLRGVNDRGTPWRVMVDAPIDDPAGHTPLCFITLTDCGIATSGNYRNYRDTESGERVSHTISPTTGLPVRTQVLSATVIAPTAMMADALATAAMAMPLGDAMDMIENLGEGYSALIVTAASPITEPSPATEATDTPSVDADSDSATEAPFAVHTTSRFPQLEFAK